MPIKDAPATSTDWISLTMQISSWCQFTPNLNAAFGTPVSNSGYLRRHGDTIEMNCFVEVGTPGGGGVALTGQPFGYTIDGNKYISTDGTQAGWYTLLEGSTTTINTDPNNGVIFFHGGPSLAFGNQVSSNAFVVASGTTIFGTNSRVNWQASFPVLGWTASKG
jgi:hypothetical protein